MKSFHPLGIFGKLRTYHKMLGIRGVWLGSKARLFRRPTEVNVQICGVRYPLALRLKTTDVYDLWNVFAMSEYEYDLSQIPDIIVDAGANIGLTSIFYATKYPHARIIAIEPEQSNYKLLLRNIRSYPQIVAIQGALCEEDCEIELLDPGYGHDGFQIRRSGGSTPHKVLGRVRGFKLESIMRVYEIDSIDLLKVDIEGSEKELFEHSLGWIGRVQAVAIETHDHLRPGCSGAVRKATADFRFERRRNGTVFLARSEDACKSGTGAAVFGERSSAKITKLPFRILGEQTVVG